jgi:ribosomal protein L4
MRGLKLLEPENAPPARRQMRGGGAAHAAKPDHNHVERCHAV